MALADALAPYVPTPIARRLQLHSVGGRVLPLDAALLFADISGSTALAERLAERGAAGAEELGRVFSDELGSVVDSVAAHAGEVIKFAGDGLFAIWPANERRSLLASVHLAAQCALAVQHARHNRGFGLALRIGIGAGAVQLLGLGDPDVHLELALLGDPVSDTCRAEELAQPGEVVLSAAGADLLGGIAVGPALENGARRVDALRASIADDSCARQTAVTPFEPELRVFAPVEIRARVGAGHAGWIAELRRVSVLFVRIPHAACQDFDTAQRSVVVVQRILGQHRGNLARVGMDAHGLALKAVFGLPPHVTEDNARRAVEAAMVIADRLGAAFGGAGIASGRVFCGDIGGAARHEYTTVGDAVHLAARLMQSASGALWCDTATALGCGEAIRFAPLEPIAVKGRTEPVPIFRPLAKAGDTRVHGRFLVGRDAEQSRLRARLDHLVARERVAPLVIEGEGGIGKSTLTQELLRLAEDRGARVLFGAASLIEESTPYLAFRAVVRGLLGVTTGGGEEPYAAEATRARVRACLETDFADGTDARAELAPLLEAVLPLGEPDNERTKQMHGQARADNLHLLLIDLLARAASRAPTVLVIEDAHWMDSASWAVVQLAAQRVQPMLLVLVMRPLGEPASAEQRRFLRDAETLRLGPLPHEAAQQLLCHRLAVADVAEPVVDWIRDRAAGHPFFIEELATALLERGMVLNTGGQCRVAPAAGDLHACDIPGTLEGVITSRIDRLSPRQQLVLKVASTIGQSFGYGAVSAAYPLADERHNLAADLEELVASDLVRREADEAGTRHYSFRHAVTQQVAYGLLPYAQRRQIHAAAARWVEQEYADRPEQAVALLAYHWGHAAQGDTSLAPRAIDLLEQAAERALATFANREAVRFLGQATALADALDGAATAPIARLRRARWQRQMGEAHYGLGEVRRARTYLEAALAQLGHPLPASKGRLAAALLVEVGRQISRRLLGGLQAPAAPDEQTHLVEAATACAFLNILLVVDMELLTSVYASVLMLNLAEPAGPSRPLAYGYGAFGLILGTFNQRLASAYLRRAMRCGDALPDRSTHLANFVAVGWFHARYARWPESLSGFASARTVAAEIGDWRFWELSTMLVGSISFARGRFRDSLGIYAEARDSAQRRGDVDSQALASVGCVTALTMLGRTHAALEMLESLQTWLGPGLETLVDRGIRINGLGMKALTLFRRGEHEAALTATAAVAALAAGAPPTSHYGLAGYAAAATVRLRLAEMAPDKGERAARLAQARVACRHLKGFARLYPFARPQFLLCEGLRRWLMGQPRAARRCWRRSLKGASELGLVFEAGISHFELGRHAGNATERRHHLARAEALLREAEAEDDVRRVEQEKQRDRGEETTWVTTP